MTSEAINLTVLAAATSPPSGGEGPATDNVQVDGKSETRRPGTSPTPADPSASAAQLQLAKLKRFLGTLVQFGLDISPEVGDRVRDLVMRLLSSSIGIEAFHSELHGATNYPLRPFVIPFLRASLPLMQFELLHRSELTGVTVAHLLSQTALGDLLLQPLLTVNSDSSGNGGIVKRHSSGSKGDEEPAVQRTKRHTSVTNFGIPEVISPQPSNSPSGQTDQRSQISIQYQQPHRQLRVQRQAGRHHLLQKRRQQSRNPEDASATDIEGDIGADADANLEDEASEAVETGGENDEAGGPATAAAAASAAFSVRDEWRRLETMLAAVADLVSKARKSLACLQQGYLAAAQQQHQLHQLHQNQQLLLAAAAAAGAFAPLHESVNGSGPRKRRAPAAVDDSRDAGMKARPQPPQQQHHQQHQQDELVSAIRRQAQQDVRLAVAAAEARAAELVSAEKLRTERLLALARDEAMAAARAQTNSVESCWNCGRMASETCSGCSIARYCGSFCQHKDWDKHQKACRSQHLLTQDSLVDSSLMLNSAKCDRR